MGYHLWPIDTHNVRLWVQVSVWFFSALLIILAMRYGGGSVRKTFAARWGLDRAAVDRLYKPGYTWRVWAFNWLVVTVVYFTICPVFLLGFHVGSLRLAGMAELYGFPLTFLTLGSSVIFTERETAYRLYFRALHLPEGSTEADFKAALLKAPMREGRTRVMGMIMVGLSAFVLWLIFMYHASDWVDIFVGRIAMPGR